MKTRTVLNFELLSNDAPEVAVVVPMFRRHGRVAPILNRLVNSLTLPTELIIIDDASPDDTLSEILSWTNELQRNCRTIRRVQILRNRWAQFETYCEKVAISRTSAPFIITVQADMELHDYGFDDRLVRALRAHSDLAAITGRSVHTFAALGGFQWEPWVFGRVGLKVKALIRSPQESASRVKKADQGKILSDIFPELPEFEVYGRAGRSGVLITSNPALSEEHKSRVWIGETICRGPIAYNRAVFDVIGGLDSMRFFLGNDDHDFCARAAYLGYRVGYAPVSFRSPLDQGTTRERRTYWTRLRIALRLIRLRVLFSSSGLGRRIRDGSQALSPPEIRQF